MDLSVDRSDRAIAPPTTIDGVSIMRWPEHRGLCDELARLGTPRLLLVESETTPPAAGDPLASWMRWPAAERDVQERVVELRRAASIVTPIIGDHGVVWRGDAWAALSPIEGRLLGELLARPGRVVTRARLERAGWPGGTPNDRAVAARVKTLRGRVAPLAIRVHAVRGQGYLAEIVPATNTSGR